MNISFTRKSLIWLKKNNISRDILTNIIKVLCYKEGRLPPYLKVHIMPKAIHSFFDLYTNTVYVAVQAKSISPRCLKLSRMLRNLLHELRHFIQYRIHKKPFAFTYSYRDAQLINSKYLNDPDEIDARKYEKKKLKFCYRLLIKP